mgnify:CR=1 FL=1
MENIRESNPPKTGLKFWRLLVAACCLASGLLVILLRILPEPREAEVPARGSLWGIGYAVVPLLMMAVGHVEDDLARMIMKFVLVGMIVLDLLIMLGSLAVVLMGREVRFIVPTALALAGAMAAHAGACYGVLKVTARRELQQADDSL